MCYNSAVVAQTHFVVSQAAMSSSIHARLDDETESLREQLRRSQGWTDSEIVRRGIKVLASTTPPLNKRKFRGVGKYNSGLGDLSTNKKYMEGFGES